jgi:hypothetical protein
MKMFNLKDKTQLDQVQIIGEKHPAKLPSEKMEWGIGFEESDRQQGKAKNQKQSSTTNTFRVRIYNVY